MDWLKRELLCIFPTQKETTIKINLRHCIVSVILHVLPLEGSVATKEECSFFRPSSDFALKVPVIGLSLCSAEWGCVRTAATQLIQALTEDPHSVNLVVRGRIVVQPDRGCRVTPTERNELRVQSIKEANKLDVVLKILKLKYFSTQNLKTPNPTLSVVY